MKTLLKINHVIGKAENLIIAIAILGMAMLMICNSIGRTMLSSSIHATEELCLLLIMLVTFFGLSNAARNGRHIIMTAIYDKLPKKAKRVSNILTNGIIFCLLLWIAYLSIRYTINVYTYGRITTVLLIPMYLFVAIIPLGCIVGAFQYFVTFLLSVTNKDILYAGSEKIEDLPVDEQVDRLQEAKKQQALTDDGAEGSGEK